MKVLHIITGLENGGAESLLFHLITGDKSGVSHEVISLMGLGFYGQRLLRAGIPVHALQMVRGKPTLPAILRLYRLICTSEPDLVQTWMYHADLIGGGIARFARRSVVWSVHHANLATDRTSLSTRIVARVCAYLSRLVPARIICCSEKAAHLHIGLGYRADKTIVVHNGTDLSRFCPDNGARLRVRAEWNVGEDEILLGMVARWDPQKDHANLIAAAEYMVSRAPLPWRCVLVGPEMQNTNQPLVELLGKRRVLDRFLLVGPRDDIADVMNALDLHILCSAGEAFGNVTIEAMACGVPAIVTDVGAGGTIVGETGWVVPPSNPIALGSAILSAMAAIGVPRSWEQRKLASRLQILENYSLERMIAGYHEVWRSALAAVE